MPASDSPTNFTIAETRVIAEAKNLLADPQKELAWYRRVGDLLARLAGEREYGRGRADRLARELGISPAQVYRLLKFAREFQTAQVAELARLGLTWGLIYWTFGLPEAERMPLLRRAAREKWSTRQVRFEVQGRAGGPRTPGRTRRPARRHGPGIDLAELARLTKAWLDHAAAAWAEANSSLTELRAMAPAGLDTGLRDRLLTVGRDLRRLGREAGRLSRALKQVAGRP